MTNTSLDRLINSIRPIAKDLFDDIALMEPEYQTKVLNLLDALEAYDSDYENVLQLHETKE